MTESAAETPEIIKPLLESYLNAVNSELPGLMIGCYLHGSIALSAFHPRFSDIDFITVVSRRCTPEDIERLKAIHEKIESDYPQWPLQGSYLQLDDLGRFEDEIAPHPCYGDGHLDTSGQQDINSITWWLLKNRGVTLFGAPAQDLNFSVDWHLLSTRMLQNMNTYWVRFARPSSRILWLLADDGIQWAVLGVVRQFYSFQEKSITSKIGAGEYALKHVPQKWHRIIQEALNIRNQTHQSLYKFRVVRAVEAVRFLRFVIGYCNAHFA